MGFLSLLLVCVQKSMGKKLQKQPQSNPRTPTSARALPGKPPRQRTFQQKRHEIPLAHAEGQMGVRPSDVVQNTTEYRVLVNEQEQVTSKCRQTEDKINPFVNISG